MKRVRVIGMDIRRDWSKDMVLDMNCMMEIKMYENKKGCME